MGLWAHLSGRGFDAAVLPCGHLRRVLCCLFGPAGACGRCRLLLGLVGVGVAGVFRERRCGRSSLCMWAVLGACEHVGAGLWLGLWAALWALGRLIGR